MTPEELRAKRRELELTQEDMAAALGCNRRHYQQMEKGERPITSERDRAIEFLLRGEPVPPDLRGGSDRGRRADHNRGDDVFRPAGTMTRSDKIFLGAAVSVFAVIGGFIWWL